MRGQKRDKWKDLGIRVSETCFLEISFLRVGASIASCAQIDACMKPYDFASLLVKIEEYRAGQIMDFEVQAGLYASEVEAAAVMFRYPSEKGCAA